MIMKQIFLRNWNFSRFLRLGIGAFVAIQGYQIEQWWFMGLGIFFMSMAFLNISTCSGSSCSVPNKRDRR